MIELLRFKKKKKTGCETPEYIAPPMPHVEPPKEESLVSCFCGGKAELEGGTYGYPTYKVRCLKCGGAWSMDTYSQKLPSLCTPIVWLSVQQFTKPRSQL